MKPAKKLKSAHLIGIPGTKYLRLESIKSHETCIAHKDTVRQLALAAQCETIAGIVQPEVCLSSMAKTFACLYFLCKNRIARTTNFEPLLDLVGFLGINLKSKISVGKNATYLSNKSIQEMLFAMSDLIEDQILNDLKRSSFFALMFDETTDCSIVEQLVIHKRFIDCAVKVKFLKILDALKPAECDEDSSSNDHIVSLNATNIGVLECTVLHTS